MFTPEYTITTKILKNIGQIEYAKSIIENTPILQHWEHQLQKEAYTDTIFAMLQLEKINVSYDAVKKTVDGLSESPIPELNNLNSSLKLIREISKNKEFDETDVRYVAKTLTESLLPRAKTINYRSGVLVGKPKPDEILAEMTEFLDWHHTLDAKDEHPVVISGITYFTVTGIFPLELFNKSYASLLSYLTLYAKGYHLKYYLNLEDYFYKTNAEYTNLINYTSGQNPDYTKCIEYYSEQMLDNVLKIADKIKLLGKDTKLAKAGGRIGLTERQERLVEYLQDYAILKNKDFARIFPDVSEDSILRDLKVLIDNNIIVKKGSTKSSRYELK